MKRLIPLLAILALLATACGDDDATTPTTAAEGRSPVYIDSVEFVHLESYPVQMRAIIGGNLPTPCHELRWELETTDPAAPVLTLWSQADPNTACAQVLEPFEETIDIGSFESGSYVLEVNGDPYPFEI